MARLTIVVDITPADPAREDPDELAQDVIDTWLDDIPHTRSDGHVEASVIDATWGDAPVVEIARRIAADAPKRPGQYVFRAGIRWSLIHDLRAALAALGGAE